MLSTDIDLSYWKYEGNELANPDLIESLVLSLCDSCGIAYPHLKLELLVSELVSNAIDHGVLALSSKLKDSNEGFDFYLSERSNRLNELTSGWIALSAEWSGANLLRIAVEDSGAGFDYESQCSEFLTPDVCAPALYGRGLVIVSGLCKSVSVVGRGNCIVVEIDLSVS